LIGPQQEESALTVDSAWALRNLGIDETRPSRGTAVATTVRAADIQREIIDFDSEGVGARTAAGAASAGLSKYVPIVWPHGLDPQPGPQPKGTSLPKCDVLVVTWTVDEGHAMSRVLTPGKDSHDDWRPYTKNFSALATEMVPRCPARQLGRLGSYWTTRIGLQKVTLFKSDSHMSQDGPQLVNAKVWKQIIRDCSPTWVITTGTGGGIGANFEVGDVIVSRFLTFDCQRRFKKLNQKSFTCATDPPTAHFAKARSLFKYNAKFLPADNKRPPKIFRARATAAGILTTDFFGFDNTANTYALQGKGDLSEMGDAVLGMVCQNLGSKAPKYVAVRNVSDPEIESTGLTLPQQTKMAADIYKAYGRWSSVCSAIVCWAIVAGL
jgi:nucleoside phosphorylase